MGAGAGVSIRWNRFSIRRVDGRLDKKCNRDFIIGASHCLHGGKMSITARVIQQFDFQHESEFMELEKKFEELEAQRPDFPKGGRRMQPIAGPEWKNTLIWECEFPSLDAAQQFLDFCATDSEHDELFRRQLPFFKCVRVEFYRNL
jgi:hypothetical protein